MKSFTRVLRGHRQRALNGTQTSGGMRSEPRAGAKQSVFFLTGSLAGGNLVAMILRLAGGVLLGRLVAPSTLGLFSGIGLILGYVQPLHLGIIPGLVRELPYSVGTGDLQRVKDLASAAQAWVLMVGGAVFLALTGVAGWQLAQGENWKAAGWFTYGILAVFLFYSTLYLQSTFRSSHDFARLAMANVAETSAGLALLLLVFLLSFYGLCLRVLLMAAISAALLFYWRPVRVGPRLDFRHLKHLIVIGAPIYGVAQMYGLWGGVVNSTLVLKFTGTEGMGLYSMVLLSTSALEIIPLATSSVVFPRMAEQYGRRHMLADLPAIARRPMLLTAAGMVPVIVAAWFLVGPVMRLVVPAYADAVPAMRWAMPLALLSSFQPMTSVFNIVRRQDLLAVATIIGIALYGGGLMLLIQDSVSLTAFPQALLIGRAVYTVLCFGFVRYLLNRERNRRVPS